MSLLNSIRLSALHLPQRVAENPGRFVGQLRLSLEVYGQPF